MTADRVIDEDSEEYWALFDEVDRECEREYNSHGMSEFGFTYKADSAQIHAEVVKRILAERVKP